MARFQCCWMLILMAVVVALIAVSQVGAEDSQWDKIGSKLSEFWDKTKETVSDGAKTVGEHAEKFGKDAKETAERLFRNAKTEVGLTPAESSST